MIVAEASRIYSSDAANQVLKLEKSRCNLRGYNWGRACYDAVRLTGPIAVYLASGMTITRYHLLPDTKVWAAMSGMVLSGELSV